MHQEARIRILLADDHALVREGIAAIIGHQEDMVVVGQAADGEEALTLFRLHQPDVTLMDLRMPRMNGIEATCAICAEFPEACILIVTTFPEELLLAQAQEAGAHGYLLKDTPRQELLQAIRSLNKKEPNCADKLCVAI